jgi:serine/threonine protein kinase
LIASEEASPRFVAGDLLAERFRVIRYIDRGGTGEVYEAEDVRDGSRVAVKALLAELADDAYALQMFRREVELASRLNHTGICRVRELVQHRDIPILAMELLEGGSLAARISFGSMAPIEALPVVREIAEALSAAHRAGLVHGDFKTSNVMLVPKPGGGVRAVVTDFGATPPVEAASSWQTPDTVAGTPAYMAPEQARGHQPTPSVDIYSLGVVLYEMLTGELPHEGNTATDLLRRRVEELAPTPRERSQHVSRRWELVILRCLEPEPSGRFANVDEVVRALEGGHIPPSPAEAGRRVKRGVLIGAAAVLATAGVILTYWLSRHP